jgi:hypothetical protein
MSTHARRFRSTVRRHLALPPRASLSAEPVVGDAPGDGACELPTGPGVRVKAWLRVGAHSLVAVLWVALPHVGDLSARRGDPPVIEIERVCPCGRSAPASDRAAADRGPATAEAEAEAEGAPDDAPAPPRRAPGSARAGR